MKIALQAQNGLEWLALQTGFIPQPVLLAHFGFIASKVIWEAVSSGIVEAMAEEAQTAATIAIHCQLNEKAVDALLHALAGLQLISFSNGKFTLTTASKKWLLKESPGSYRAQLLFDNQVCYPWLNQTSDYLRTGKGLQYHETLQPKEWGLYHDAMQATSHHISKLAAQKIKLPTAAGRLLDIGGAHGLYSSALLQKFPQLTAEVLDLPEAIAANAGKLSLFTNRLRFVAGNILKDELVPESYDTIIMANVAHHFTEAENRLVARKAKSALRTNGRFYILEFFRKDTSAAPGDMIGALQSFFFALSSTSGLWKAAEIKSWLAHTGFQEIKTQTFTQFPGFGLVRGTKT